MKNFLFIFVSCAILASCTATASSNTSDLGPDGPDSGSYLKEVTIGGNVYSEVLENENALYVTGDNYFSAVTVVTGFSGNIDVTVSDDVFTATIPEPETLEPLTGWNFLDGVIIKKDLLRGVTVNSTITPAGVNFAVVKGLKATRNYSTGEETANLTYGKLSISGADSDAFLIVEQGLYIYVDNDVSISGVGNTVGNTGGEDDGDADHIMFYSNAIRKTNLDINLKKGWNIVCLTAAYRNVTSPGRERSILYALGGASGGGSADDGGSSGDIEIEIKLECKELSQSSKWAYEKVTIVR